MQSSVPTYSESSFWMRKVSIYVNDHLGESISLTDVASAAGLSRYTLCRLFRVKYNVSPMRWLIQTRLEASRSMLMEKPALPIADVAVFCGFSSPSHLTRSFKKIFGLAPSDFRKSLHVINIQSEDRFAEAG